MREAQFGGVSQTPLVERTVYPPPPGVVRALVTCMHFGTVILLRWDSPSQASNARSLTPTSLYYPIWYYVVALVAAHRFRGCDFRVCAARTVVRLRKKSSYNVSTNLYALEGAPTFTELIELVQTEFVFTEAMKITQCYILTLSTGPTGIYGCSTEKSSPSGHRAMPYRTQTSADGVRSGKAAL
jgi:hypothetical protein